METSRTPGNASSTQMTPAWYGEVKTISRHDLEKYTSEGWVLLHMYEEHQGSVEHGSAALQVDPQQMNNGCYYGDGTVNTMTPIQITEWFALIGKDRDTSIKERTERIEILEAKEKELGESLKAKVEELRTTTINLQRTQESSAHYREQSDSYREQSEDRVNTIRRLEEDLGKVRTAIGTDRFKEILSE